MATGNGLVAGPIRTVGRSPVDVTAGRTTVDLCQRDRPDFERAYDAYDKVILRYCLSRISNPAEAEDAAATVFAKALAAWPPNNPAAVRSWLFAIAHNVVASHHRASYRRESPRSLDHAMHTPDRAIGPEETAIAVDEQARLHAAVAKLNPEQREVVHLRLAGLTGPEIAQTTGRSHAAVKMLQLRAIQNLRQILALTEGRPTHVQHEMRKEANRGQSTRE